MLPRICALVGLRAIDIFQLSGLRLNQPRDYPASSSISPLAVRCPALPPSGSSEMPAPTMLPMARTQASGDYFATVAFTQSLKSRIFFSPRRCFELTM